MRTRDHVCYSKRSGLTEFQRPCYNLLSLNSVSQRFTLLLPVSMCCTQREVHVLSNLFRRRAVRPEHKYAFLIHRALSCAFQQVFGNKTPLFRGAVICSFSMGVAECRISSGASKTPADRSCVSLGMRPPMPHCEERQHPHHQIFCFFPPPVFPPWVSQSGSCSYGAWTQQIWRL